MGGGVLTRSGLALGRLATIVRTIVDELGDERAAMIDTIDPTPLSTASIAQVHLARLDLTQALTLTLTRTLALTLKVHLARLVSGERVVLKVQHPEVAA